MGLLDPDFWRFSGVSTGLLGPEPSQTSGLLSPGTYDPRRPGWHSYIQGPDLVCPASLACAQPEIADQLARAAVPGQNPELPVTSGGFTDVYIPHGPYVGQVRNQISNGGLTITNKTVAPHIFYDGEVVRTAVQGPNGEWYAITSGLGNNVVPGMNMINEFVGPDIFRDLDEQLKSNIARNHAGQ